MRSRHFALLMVLLIYGARIGPADALEALSTDALAAFCLEGPRADGTVCLTYVRGFIDGAVVTDERVTYNVADEIDRAESFTERAYRTRLGRSLERFGPSYYADFCIGLPVPLAEIVRHVRADLASGLTGDEETARAAVYASLRRHYPCRETE